MANGTKKQDWPRYFAQFGLTLYDNGYPVIPLVKAKKKPLWKGWSDWGYEKPPYASIERAAEKHPHAGIGFACGALIVVIDIDEDVGERAFSVQQLAVACLGETPLVRFGQNGRRSLFYRVEGTPIASQDCGQVQVLGVGKFSVALGIHPDTGVPYTWQNDGPEYSSIDDLPPASQAKIDTFCQHLRLHYDIASDDTNRSPRQGGAIDGSNRKKYGSVSSLLPNVVQDENGIVTDGRDRFLLSCVNWAYEAGRGDPEAIAEIAWERFSAQADLGRSNPARKRPWLKKDALIKARYVVRNRDRGRGRDLRRWRMGDQPGSNRPIIPHEKAALEKAVLLASDDGRLPRSAVRVHREMIELAEKSGRCFVSIEKLAARLGVSASTVVAARRRLREVGFWYTLAGDRGSGRGGRGRLTVYAPNFASVGLRTQTVVGKEENPETQRETHPRVYHVGASIEVGASIPVNDRVEARAARVSSKRRE